MAPEAALDFFHGLGLLTQEEYGGRVYPLSNSANSVLDVLRFALDRAGVEQRCACPVKSIRRESGLLPWRPRGALHADRLILACGGAAGAKLGGVMDGYQLAKALGHKRTGLYPALVQLVTEPEYPRALKGVRADCRLRLLRREFPLAESRGELQFTETGVSGPAAFDLSRAAATGGEGLTLHIRLLPWAEEELLACCAAAGELPGASRFGDPHRHAPQPPGPDGGEIRGAAAGRPCGSLTERSWTRWPGPAWTSACR